MIPNNLTRRSMLVVDVDLQYLDTLKNDKKISNYPVQVAHTGRAAYLIINNRDVALVGIFVSPALKTEPNWISVIRCAYLKRPATPLYLISNNKEEARELTTVDLKRLGIRDLVHKPKSVRELISIVSPLDLTFDAQDALERSSDKIKVGDVVVDANMQEYIPIRADDFLSGSKSFFDVFVKIGTNRFIKLLQSGEVFDPERLENYILKGVTHFYILKEIQEVYLSYCDHLTKALLNSDQVSIEVKTSQTLNQGEETINHFRNIGVTAANIQYALRFESNVRELASQLLRGTVNKNRLVSKFIKTAALYEHGVGTSMIAGILANAMQFCADNPLQIIGMASLMHDIGLINMPKDIWTEDESRMTPNQIELYETHPVLGAAILNKINAINPSAVQAVEQHHMRLAGRGFPRRKGTTIVNQMAEIVGISCEYQHVIQKAHLNPATDIRTELEFKVLPFFSRQIVQEFKKIFFPPLPIVEEVHVKIGNA